MNPYYRDPVSHSVRKQLRRLIICQGF
jgi:hypothetical protein